MQFAAFLCNFFLFLQFKLAASFMFLRDKLLCQLVLLLARINSLGGAIFHAFLCRFTENYFAFVGGVKSFADYFSASNRASGVSRAFGVVVDAGDSLEAWRFIGKKFMKIVIKAELGKKYLLFLDSKQILGTSLWVQRRRSSC